MKRFFQGGLGLAGALLLLALVVISTFPHLFARRDPYAINADARLRPPAAAHPFGTDELGRDVFSRVVWGTRISLGSALLVVGASGTAGTLLGLVAGYFGGRLDEALMRVADVFIAFPALIMAMAMVALLGPGLTNAMLAIMIIWWPQYARLARGQVAAEKVKPYSEAARAVGRRDLGILFRHILPNCWVPILIKATLDIGVAILLTASLSFLGLGARPPTPELGALVTQGREHLLSAWWYSTFPGLVMFVGVLACNLLGDSLRDVLDPVLSTN
ncbi:MAG: ABC transporter permease [Armatimonadetes bacterium]|nr:ABC transporter permease [Armatimonadota bacterium]